MEKLIKKTVLETEITLLTGLHIGGSKESVEIGGIDSPVIKVSTKNNQPYIPGSSLKGKLRSLLEQIAGASEVGGGTKKNYKEKSSDIQQIIDLFGFAKDNKPSRLIVRDSYLTDDSLNLLENSEYLDMPYTENKFENTIDRITGVTKGGGLRQIERVPAGVSFKVEFIINVWDNLEDEKKSIDLLKKGLNAIENDYLGGSGSRGYGQIKFSDLKTKNELTFEKYFTHES
jgi:CRISPR-associated protein Csm3